jgi:hypothetical protein
VTDRERTYEFSASPPDTGLNAYLVAKSGQ